LSNFDVLWTTFAENYPSFAAHQIDWEKARGTFRPVVGDAKRASDLFSLFEKMLSPLEDKHVVLEIFPPGTPLTKAWLRTPTRIYQGEKSGIRIAGEADEARAQAIVDSYLDAQPATYCRDKIRFGSIGDRVGYLDLRSFHGYAADDSFSDGLLSLQRAAQEIFASIERKAHLIIDLRNNTGGDDPYGLEIASHLTRQRYLAWAMKARLDPTDRKSFTAPAPVYVEVSSGPVFTGDIAVLIGPKTASAAETFLMSLLGRSPSATKIGESTQGVFSDVLDRRLPNGWRLVLPNQILVTSSGNSFDVLGVPPDVRAPVFARRDLQAGRDPGIEAALRLWDETTRRQTAPALRR
jgi:C-terminal processing protease CtpA/Prc